MNKEEIENKIEAIEISLRGWSLDNSENKPRIVNELVNELNYLKGLL